MKTGVLITNLGTPDAPTAKALRRYLKEFLWDERVVDVPRPLWWLILNGIILNTRPAKSAEAYEQIWTPEGSPLLVISKQQTQKIQKALGADVPVVLGMRYGKPSLKSAYDALKKQGCSRIVVLPLYPQYSCATTASTFDKIAEIARKDRNVPQFEFVRSYCLDESHTDSLTASIQDYWNENGKTQMLLFSFHGLPQRYLKEGDRYFHECYDTTQAVVKKLGLQKNQYKMTFQSRFGKEPWIKPYTDEVIAALAQKGITHLDVVCPGFSADCVETLEEIDMQNREIFQENGGQKFRYIPCLNDRDDHIESLVRVLKAHL